MRAAIFSGALMLATLTYTAAACRQDAAGGGDPAQPPAASSPAQGQSTPGAGQDSFAAVARITVGELAAALKQGRAVAVDVRPAEAFEEEHIRGALSIPEAEVVERAGELPKDKLVVAYCA